MPPRTREITTLKNKTITLNIHKTEMTELFKKYIKIIIREISHKAIKIIFNQMKRQQISRRK